MRWYNGRNMIPFNQGRFFVTLDLYSKILANKFRSCREYSYIYWLLYRKVKL